MLFCWLTATAVALWLLPGSYTGKLQFSFAGVFSRPLTISRHFFNSRRQSPASDQGDYDHRQFNEMRNYLENVTQQLAQQREKVEKLAGVRDRGPFEAASLVVSQVVSASVAGARNEMIIDRGQIDGLVQGQFVMAEHSIIGIVSQVRSSTSVVRLLSDSELTIPVSVAEHQSERMMRGLGNGTMTVMLMSAQADVQIGDPVFVRPKPGFLETPVIAAVVTRARRNADNPLIWDIQAEPATEIADISTVIVIVTDQSRPAGSGQ